MGAEADRLFSDAHRRWAQLSPTEVVPADRLHRGLRWGGNGFPSFQNIGPAARLGSWSLVLPALSRVAPVLNPLLNRLFSGIREEGEEFTPREVRHPSHGLAEEGGEG